MLVWPDVAGANDLPFFAQVTGDFLTLTMALLLCGTPEVLGLNEEHGWRTNDNERKLGVSAIKPVQKCVSQILAKHGPTHTCGACHMEQAAVWRHCQVFEIPFAAKEADHFSWKTSPQWNGAKNGVVSSPTKIIVPLCWFMGGSTHCVVTCAWKVVDAVSECLELLFRFCGSHEEQLKIANGCQQKQSVIW